MSIIKLHQGQVQEIPFKQGDNLLELTRNTFHSKTFTVSHQYPVMVDNGKREEHIVVLCDDEGLLISGIAPEYETPTLLRPWDGHPLFGPILFTQISTDLEGEQDFGPLDPQVQDILMAALIVLGYRKVG
jgi:hypothetical protein